MNINLNFGEHFHEGGNSFWINVLIAFIGAFFGLLFALYVNRLFEKRTNNKQKEIKDSIDLERIRYLGIILKSVLDSANKQIKYYFDLSDSIKKDPLKIQTPVQVASFDVWRLRNLNSIELFDSYFNFFKKEKNILKNYKNIFAHGDYIYEELKESKIVNERHRNFQHKDEIFVRDCIENIYIKIGLRIKNLQITNGNGIPNTEEFQYLRHFETIYHTFISDGVADFSKIQNEYFKPLHDTILSNVQNNEFADEIFTIVKKAINRQKNIEFNAIEFAKDMETLKSNTKDSIDYLDNQIKEIEKRIELSE